MKSFKWLLVVILFFSGFFIVKNYVYSTTPPPEDLSSIPLEGEPRNLAINPYTDQALVTSTRPNELSVVDLNTGQITTTLQVKKKPFGLAIDCGKNLALVSFKAHHRLSVIDLSTYQCLAEIPVGKAPCNVAVYEAAGGPHLGLTANYGSDTVSVINLETFRVIKTIRVGRGPRDIAVDPGLKLALVVNEDTHNVAVIDLNSLRVTGWVPVGRRPRSISINPETHLAAVANGRENYITTIDLTNWQSLRIPIDKNPLDVAINPLDNRALVVCNRSHSLHLIDLDTHTTIQKYPLNRQTRGLAVNPFTNIAGVVDRQTDSLTLIQLPNPVPDIQSITPVTVLRNSPGTSLSIQGSGFIKTSAVTLGSSPVTLPVIFKDNHSLTATLPAGLFTQAGSYQVSVNNPTPDGGPSNALTLQVENPIPTLTALDPASTQAGGQGMTVKLYGTGFFPETTISINGQARSCSFVSGTALELPLGPADLASAGDLELKAINPGPGGGISNPINFTVTAVNPIPVLSSLSPNSVKAGSPGFTLTLTGSNFISNSAVLFNNTPVSGTLVDNSRIDVSIPGTAILTAGTFPVTVQNPGPGGGSSGSLSFTVTPASNVTPPPAGSFGKTYEDLIPPDATIPSYDPKRFSLITGLVKDGSGNPLAGVGVGIHGQSEYGTAQTDATGRFSIPVDGGGTITVAYQKTGFIPAHRQVQVGWNTIANVETIVLIAEDTASSALTFDGNAATILTHKSTPTIDAFGSRSLTMVLTGDNRAWVKDAQGNEQPLTNITVRATEYPTPESMPAKLPPTSAFTYCAELSVDGAKSVRFEKPVAVYVDNFLGFNIGEIVPVGYYDRDRAVWVPANNGVVVQLLDTNGDGLVDAYTDGQNQYPAPGLNDSNLYRPGATYWRVELTHFSPWDCNWPIGFPSGAISPNPDGSPVADNQRPNDDNSCINSYVENRNRIFHEDIPIPGTEMTLHYASNRTRGYKSVVTIPASGASVPASLKNIIVRMEVAGRIFETTLLPQPNQKAEFVWDGLDYLGRQVFGSSLATISIGFVYQAFYYSGFNSSWLQSFGQVGASVTMVESRQEMVSWGKSSITIDRSGTGILAEGWTLSLNHYLNPFDPNTLYKGDGTIVKNTMVISTKVGSGQYLTSGDGGAAIHAGIAPVSVSVDKAGNLYLADNYNNRIRKVDKKGIITTIAGNGQLGYGGDGGSATEAQLSNPIGIAVDEMGNVYIADTNNNRIRKVNTNGIITTIAGNGQQGFTGDGGLASQASLSWPYGVVVDSGGSVYIVEAGNSRVRKIDPNGIITTVAGNAQYGYFGDGMPATQASLYWPTGIALDLTGNIYIADSLNHRIRKVDTSGIITTVAGNGQFVYSGDGGLATQASLSQLFGVSVDNAGNIFIGDTWNTRIRKVDTRGFITSIAGNGQWGYSGDGGPGTQAILNGPYGVTVDSGGNIYFADFFNYRIRKVSLPETESFSVPTGDIAFADENGQGYILSDIGLHKSTIDLATGNTLLTFGYDQSGKLSSITDRFGNLTTIQRDGSGVPLSITSSDGIITRLTVDGNNQLTAVTYPDNSVYSFAYTSEGLMTDKYDPKGNHFRQQYNNNGTISSVLDPEGGSWNFNRSIDASGNITVTLQTAEGNTTTYRDRTDSTGAYTSIKTDPAGSVSTFTRTSDGLTETEKPSCGMNRTWKYDLDPSYKYKYIKELTQSSPAGLIQTTTDIRSYQDTNGDTIPDLITRTLNRNGNNWTTVNNTLAGTLTSSSPLGRTITFQYDPANLLTIQRIIPGLYDTVYSYDNKGRLTTVGRNSRMSSFDYNPQGFLISITDPENKTTAFSYDTMGRVIRLDGPNGYLLNFTYDLNGNMTVLTNPSLIDHSFGYNTINLNNFYQTPLSGSYSYLYDKERNFIRVTFPSGLLINNIYSQGRLVRTETPEGNIVFNYLCSSKIGNITKGTEGITFTYDGSLITSEILNGSLNQTMQYTYNNDFKLSSFTYAGQMVNYTYDNDGLLTGAGSFTIGRNAFNGLPMLVTDGTLNLTRTFNGHGEKDGEDYALNGQPPFSWSLTRTNTGRISSRSETVGGTSTNYTYTYDPMGRLLTAVRDGSLVEQYQYSSNGTRIFEMNSLRGIAGRTSTYSIEDHLLTTGNTLYQYNPNGFLTSKTQGTNTTNYTYSSRGELLSVLLPDGHTIEYLHDPLARRIAKKVNGNVTEKYLWQGRTRLLAVYDGNDNLLMRFNYANGRMPVSMRKNGALYYLGYDQIGSLKVVADSAGNVVKKIDYDSFGNIITDTAPSFSIPFSFAGGLYDPDTGLVRFGFRDFSPEIGRWTAKDPILFHGGDPDLFSYLMNDPINFFDKYGLDSTSWRGDGRSIWDGPKNGNWGGQNWSGGWNPLLHGGQNGPAPPTDSGDNCYMNHDNCYLSSGACGKAIKACNKELGNCLEELPNNSKEWPYPPRPGTEDDSETFRRWAIEHFKPRSE